MSRDRTPGAGDGFEDLLAETRRFPPSEDFRARARVQDDAAYAFAEADPAGFWAGLASELEWSRPWSHVLEGRGPDARWFVGGQINASVNCLDRHVRGPGRNKAALLWEGEPGERRTITYFELYREVNRFASVLKRLGVSKGDRVILYMPLLPEAVVAMLACARIGAIHGVVFGGFSADSLRDRIEDAQAKILVTADGGYRRGKLVPLKDDADRALRECPSIQRVIVVQRAGSSVTIQEGRDHWYHDLLQDAPLWCEPVPQDSDDPLFILYTSGTTGKPKGIVHATGGYLTGVHATMRWVFDLRDEDVFWCTADIGWVTGHSYVTYGPLAAGATVVLYEGAPDWPQKSRCWEICERYGVTIFYTAPTAIRAFMKWGERWPQGSDLARLRLLGTVGEPINPEVWTWYHRHIGGGRCPIVDTWWQTETGHVLITPLPGVTVAKPGSATRPFPGIIADILNERGESVPVGGGYLVIRTPWPGMTRGIWGDRDRYLETYWSRFGDTTYFTGDGAKRDADGYFWILGRVDDVINVAGHRIGTMEIESALLDHPAVAEAAVVGVPHEIKGTAIAAFVTLREGRAPSTDLAADLKQHVVVKIGAIARPEQILFTADLPKTRSGKIMRRLLRDIAEGRALGDTTTLADPSVVESLKENYSEDAGV